MATAETTAKRRVIRVIAFVFLVLASILIGILWLAPPSTASVNALVSAGVVLCLSANLLSLLLLAAGRES
ncbi:MAG: hypothetical protein ACFBSD_10350 [Paracoccaceae bacterium]